MATEDSIMEDAMTPEFLYTHEEGCLVGDKIKVEDGSSWDTPIVLEDTPSPSFTHMPDLTNPEGMFKHGKRLREWSPNDLLPSSARPLPVVRTPQTGFQRWLEACTPRQQPRSRRDYRLILL
ncbi:hypothetical protein B0T24DRAFT_599223 [Lasiosphaeria ovina]|uniref:Uncharacterized protein n=1 Tax=Lasiosphaeria ovina TaxID=92902 RepID=A0AAE0MY93_9PEZI|nr:hypothetical protein B0T24DRAFT_599223 [Lasiosphaeria ovina]